MTTSRRALVSILTTLMVGSPPSLAMAQAAPGAAQPPAATEAPLPNPTTDRQEPRPVSERPRDYPSPPRSEVGADIGLVARPASGDVPVHYPVGWSAGGHVRVDLLDWLGARLSARIERSHAGFDEGALGLPRGTIVDQPDLRRIGISLAFEPQWRPVPRLLLFVGLGAGWGRTTAEKLRTSGAETVTLPSRSSVFIELPVSLGGRFELIPDVLVVNLSGSASLLFDQSGRMLEPYDTPGKDGTLTTVGGFPKQGPSFSLVTGLGVLL